MIARLLTRTHELELSQEALDQPVSYTAKTEEYATLGDYIAAYAPDLAADFSIQFAETDYPIRRVTELTNDELKELTCARLAQGDEDEQLVVMGDGSYSIAALTDHVKRETQLGRRLMDAARRSVHLLESLVDAGKVRPTEQHSAPVRTRMPKTKS